MTDNTARPIAPSGFRPNLRTIPNPNGGGGDVAEYITPEASGLESGFYTTERGLPWHVTLARRLNTPELMTGTDRKLTKGEALVLAGLDFEVAMAPTYALIEDVYVPVPGKFVTFRTDTNAVLGSNRSTTYRIMQNEAIATFAEALVDEGGLLWESGGSLYGGRQVFLAMELPDSMHVANDPSTYRLFLVVSNGHDGKHLFRADITIERVLCRNTLRIAQKGAVSSFALRHNATLDQRVQEAREALGLTFRYAETFSETAGALAERSLVDRQVDAILRDVFPITELQQKAIDEDASAFAKTTAAKVRAVYDESPTVARGSAYGVVNAVSEYVDHFAKYANEDRRADRLMFDDPKVDPKQRVWDRVLVETGLAPKSKGGRKS
jgi:phage/plasmid-like protein (TIGR03299 family)